jgi:hypothetical protein
MKMLFSSMDLSEASSVKTLLSGAGVPCAILHDAMSPAMLEKALYPEVWIENDQDFLEASALLASWRRDLPAIFAKQHTPDGALNVLPL